MLAYATSSGAALSIPPYFGVDGPDPAAAITVFARTEIVRFRRDVDGRDGDFAVAGQRRPGDRHGHG